MARTGHFAILLTDVQHVIMRDLILQPHRDGVDLVGVRHCVGEHVSSCCTLSRLDNLRLTDSLCLVV